MEGFIKLDLASFFQWRVICFEEKYYQLCKDEVDFLSIIVLLTFFLFLELDPRFLSHSL